MKLILFCSLFLSAFSFASEGRYSYPFPRAEKAGSTWGYISPRCRPYKQDPSLLKECTSPGSHFRCETGSSVNLTSVFTKEQKSFPLDELVYPDMRSCFKALKDSMMNDGN